MVRIRASCRATVRRCATELPGNLFATEALHPPDRHLLQGVVIEAIEQPPIFLDDDGRRFRSRFGSNRSGEEFVLVVERGEFGLITDQAGSALLALLATGLRDRLAGRDHDEQAPEVVAVEEVGERPRAAPWQKLSKALSAMSSSSTAASWGFDALNFVLASPTILRKNRSQSSRTASSAVSTELPQEWMSYCPRVGHPPIA